MGETATLCTPQGTLSMAFLSIGPFKFLSRLGVAAATFFVPRSAQLFCDIIVLSRRSKKEDSSIVLMFQEQFFRALQGHSGPNLIDPSLQDNVIIQSNFVHHIFHWMCVQFAFFHQFWIIPRGQSSSKRERQYSSCLSILWTKVTRILM